MGTLASVPIVFSSLRPVVIHVIGEPRACRRASAPRVWLCRVVRSADDERSVTGRSEAARLFPSACADRLTSVRLLSHPRVSSGQAGRLTERQGAGLNHV